MRLSWLSIIFTLIILYFAATRLDWVSLWNAIWGIDPVFLILALSMWVILVCAKSLKWKLIVRALNGKISLFDSFRMLMIGLFVGIMTPGRVGDFLRAAYVKEKVGLGAGIMGVFIDRAMDVFTLLVFSGIGIVGLFRATGIHLISDELLIGIFIVFGVVVFLSLKRSVARRIWPLLKKVIPASLSGMISRYGSQFFDSIPLLKKNTGTIAQSFLVGLAAWLLTITFGYFLMQGTGIPLGWEVAMLCIPILSLIEIIPFGIAGIGTRELAAVIVFGAYGIPAESAIVFSLLYFAFGYIPSFILGSYFFNRQPVPMKNELDGLLAQMGSKKKN